MLTTRGNLDDRLMGLETGASAYLTKPFAPKELLTTVRSLLEIKDATATSSVPPRRIPSPLPVAP